MNTDEKEKQQSGTGPTQAKFWAAEIDNAMRAEEDWRKEAARLIAKYNQEKKESSKFNILWANVETIKPTVYSSRPVPDVRRRFADPDPIAREVARVVERSLKYCIDVYDFDGEIRKIRDEMLITGRGVPWVEYEADIATIKIEQDGVNEYGEYVSQEVEQEVVTDQTIKTLHLHYKNFAMCPADCWDKVRWVARKHTPTRDEMRRLGLSFADKISLTHSAIDPEVIEENQIDSETFKRAVVWEIWNKPTGKRIWYGEGYKDGVDEEDVPIELAGFFPMPKPLYSFNTPGTMIPVAEYTIYEEQAIILNATSQKIMELTTQLSIKGVSADVSGAMKKLSKGKNGDLIPLEGLADINNLDMNKMVAWWPFEKIAAALLSLYQARDEAEAVIQKITGISDIVRGATKASETATAQQLKGNFASIRMQTRQQAMEEMVRDIFRIKSEILAENFLPETLQAMTGLPVLPQMVQVMRDDRLRSYRIDVETNSTVQADADADKQRRIEFMEAISGFFTQVAPLVQSGIMPIELAKSLLRFAMKGFPISREVEDAIEDLGTQQQPQQEGPSPDQQLKAKELEIKERDQALDEYIEPKKLQIEAAEAQADIMAKTNPMTFIQ